MDNLTAFQRDLLYVIAGSDNLSGLTLKKDLQQYYSGEINHGRLYPNLDNHADDGIIKKGTIDDRTNSYTLTPLGEAVLAVRRGWENRHLSSLFSSLSATAPTITK